jgi:hypothetical protein
MTACSKRERKRERKRNGGMAKSHPSQNKATPNDFEIPPITPLSCKRTRDPCVCLLFKTKQWWYR